MARRCGLLHDIGKAADHELEGGHPKIGADLLKRHGEKPEVVHAALGHHDEIVTEYPYTMLVATADACSASRPGARRESLERYIKRMEELESIACGFPGVEQAFAIQAGRELRVIASCQRHRRRQGRQDLPRHRQGLRRAAHVSRRDQGDGGPRIAVHGSGDDRPCRVAVIAEMTHVLGNLTSDLGHRHSHANPAHRRHRRQTGRADRHRALPGLAQARTLDLVIANAENAADGSGLTPSIYRKLIAAGVDCITLGDHIYRRSEIVERPATPPKTSSSRPTFPPPRPASRGASSQPRDGTQGRRDQPARPRLHAAGRLPVGPRPTACWPRFPPT